MSIDILMAWLSGYWLILALALVAVSGVVAWVLTSRRRVAIAPPTLDDPVVTPTLAGTSVSLTPPAPVTPLAELAPAPTGHADIPPAEGPGDDLSKLKGIGPRLAKLLNELGVMRFDQIAAWTPENVAEVNSHLGSFAGRIDKDRWIEQARFLAERDVAGFEARFGKLDSEIA